MAMKMDANDRRRAGMPLEADGVPMEPANDNNSAAPSAQSGKLYRRTDVGNAERLADRHRHELQHCHPWKKDLIWDGRRWKLDDAGAITQMAKETVRSIYEEAARILDEHERAEMAKHALSSESGAHIAAMMKLARSEQGIPVLPKDLDTHRWLLNVANGTIDLRTAALLPHEPKNLLTKLVPIDYDPDAPCDAWLRFLDQITCGRDQLRDFLWRAVGYSLTGDVREHALFFLHGGGSNGKTTFVEVVLALTGEYGCQAAPDLLMANGERHPTEIADLFGRRFVVGTETEQGKRMNEVVLKRLTGGDRVSARRMKEDWWEFDPLHKLWLSGNHKPEVRGTDHALWRRMRLIPFDAVFLDDEESNGAHRVATGKKDKTLPGKLAAELPGILAWAVRGCIAWQRDGLNAPTDVRAATDQYRAEMDTLGRFLDEQCQVGKAERVGATPLYNRYVAWCQQNNEAIESQRNFGQRMTERGFERKVSNGKAVYVGIGLREHKTEPTAQESFPC